MSENTKAWLKGALNGGIAAAAGSTVTAEIAVALEKPRMPNEKGEGFVDYVLWGDDGKPLGLVEAKRTKRDARVGQQQTKLYADCLEKRFGQRPIIFYSNGYEHCGESR